MKIGIIGSGGVAQTLGSGFLAKGHEVKLGSRDAGWDVEDLGGIDQAFFLEAFASIWINYGFKNNTWTHAFKFLKR